MTFQSLTPAQQRELKLAYDDGGQLNFGNRLVPTFWRLKQLGLVDVHFGVQRKFACITHAGRELYERRDA